jgi:uncharacterized membrane protein YhaH (DUF805 family)
MHYGISFIDAIKRGFKKYATFSGRASRSEYWWWALLSNIGYVVLLAPAYVLGITTSSDGGRTPGAAAIPLIILMVIFCLAIIVPTLALTVRRLHDAGFSGWLALLMLVPYLGGLIILIFTVLPSLPAESSTTRYRQFRLTTTPLSTAELIPPLSPYPAQNTYPPQGH